MLHDTARRILVLLVVVALAAAFQLRSVQGFSAEAQAAIMNADMPAPGKCNGCVGNEKAMTASACSAYCTTVMTLSFFGVAYDPVFVGIIASTVEVATTGHTTPPDPYPPRPTRMS